MMNPELAMLGEQYEADPDEMSQAAVGFRQEAQQGGMSPLQQAAEGVRQSGRHEDSYLVHVNKSEFDQMVQQFGPPLINPQTGIPEWGWEDYVKYVGPALSVFAPSLGSYLGNAATGLIGNFAPGMANAISPYASTIGSGLMGAAIPALTGGNRKDIAMSSGLSMLGDYARGKYDDSVAAGGSPLTSLFKGGGAEAAQQPTKGGGLFGGMNIEQAAKLGLVGAALMQSGKTPPPITPPSLKDQDPALYQYMVELRLPEPDIDQLMAEAAEAGMTVREYVAKNPQVLKRAAQNEPTYQQWQGSR